MEPQMAFVSFMVICCLVSGSNACFRSKVDGGWGQWSEFSKCSAFVVDATKTRSRQCDNPEPKNGGNSCAGSSEEVKNCVYTKVLVALGFNGEIMNDVEIIDLQSPTTRCKKPANFPYANSESAGGLTQEKKPLICGGMAHRDECHVYEDGSWKSSGSLKQGKRSFAMTTISSQDGSKQLFLTGGYGLNHLSSSEVLTNTGWEMSASLPVKIYRHCMVAIDDTSVMVIGGKQNDQTSGRTWLFNTKYNTWSAGPELQTARDAHSCGLIRKSQNSNLKTAIAVGGYAGSRFFSSAEVLDPSRNVWRRTADLPIGIVYAEMVPDPSGGVVLIGGVTLDRKLDRLFKLPHAGDGASWEVMPQKLRNARHSHTVILVPDEIADCN